MAKECSDVIVTFKDGEVKTYCISAGTKIGGYLATTAGQTGVLSLFSEDRSWGIPMTSIRDWEIVPVEPAAEG